MIPTKIFAKRKEVTDKDSIRANLRETGIEFARLSSSHLQNADLRGAALTSSRMPSRLRRKSTGGGLWSAAMENAVGVTSPPCHQS